MRIQKAVYMPVARWNAWRYERLQQRRKKIECRLALQEKKRDVARSIRLNCREQEGQEIIEKERKDAFDLIFNRMVLSMAELGTGVGVLVGLASNASMGLSVGAVTTVVLATAAA
jgi:hypothetical protein